MTEHPPIPRYNDEEWDVVKNLAQPDILIPRLRFPSHLRVILKDIIKHGDMNDINPAPQIETLAQLSDEQLRTLQWWLEMTYLELALWHGDMKNDIFGTLDHLRLTAERLQTALEQDSPAGRDQTASDEAL